MLNKSFTSLHTKFASVAHPAEGQFLHDTEMLVKFLVSREGNLSVKEGQNFDPTKRLIKKKDNKAISSNLKTAIG